MGADDVWKRVEKSMKQIVPKLELIRALELVPGFRTVKEKPNDDLILKSMECRRSDGESTERQRIVKKREDHGTEHFQLLNAGLWRTGDKCEYRTKTQGWVPGTILPSFGSGQHGYRVKLGLTGQIREQVSLDQLREPLLPGELIEACIVHERHNDAEPHEDQDTGSTETPERVEETAAETSAPAGSNAGDNRDPSRAGAKTEDADKPRKLMSYTVAVDRAHRAQLIYQRTKDIDKASKIAGGTFDLHEKEWVPGLVCGHALPGVENTRLYSVKCIFARDDSTTTRKALTSSRSERLSNLFNSILGKQGVQLRKGGDPSANEALQWRQQEVFIPAHTADLRRNLRVGAIVNVWDPKHGLVRRQIAEVRGGSANDMREVRLISAEPEAKAQASPRRHSWLSTLDGGPDEDSSWWVEECEIRPIHVPAEAVVLRSRLRRLTAVGLRACDAAADLTNRAISFGVAEPKTYLTRDAPERLREQLLQRAATARAAAARFERASVDFVPLEPRWREMRATVMEDSWTELQIPTDAWSDGDDVTLFRSGAPLGVTSVSLSEPGHHAPMGWRLKDGTVELAVSTLPTGAIFPGVEMPYDTLRNVTHAQEAQPHSAHDPRRPEGIVGMFHARDHGPSATGRFVRVARGNAGEETPSGSESGSKEEEVLELDFLGSASLGPRTFANMAEKKAYMRSRFAEALRDGTLDELALEIEQRRADRESSTRRTSPDRPNPLARRRSSAEKPQPPPSAATTPLQQRLVEAFPGVELEDVHVAVDEPLEIDFEGMAEAEWPDGAGATPGSAAGLFLRRERTTLQEM